MLVLFGVRLYLLDLGRGNILGVNAAHSNALAVDLQHDLGRLLAAQGEEFLQHYDDEIHGSVVVVEQPNLEHRRLLDLRLLGFKNRVFTLPERHAESALNSSPRLIFSPKPGNYQVVTSHHEIGLYLTSRYGWPRKSTGCLASDLP